MFDDPTFSITRNRKPQTKNSKTSNENTTRLSVFERTSPQKRRKNQVIFMFCESWIFLEEPL
jgi:hypothetical protein